MTGEVLHTYLAALASSLTIGVIVPLLILAIVLRILRNLLLKAQASEGFDIAQVLKDDDGKVSSIRFLSFLAFAISTWALAVVMFAHPDHIDSAFLAYLIVWSASRPALELAQKWNGQLPFAKGQ